jgi:hypothetical protein
MKIRSGFVSNSSSSSFILKGFLVSKDIVSKRKLLEVFGFDFKELEKAMSEYSYKSEEDAITDLFYEYMYELKGDVFVGSSKGDGNPNNNVYMIGEIITTLDDDCYCIGYSEIDFTPSNKINELQEKLGTNEPIKVICSTRMC